MRALILAVLACLISTPAGAQIDNYNNVLVEKHFTRDMPITIEFQDSVTDGCLPRPGSIKAAIEVGVRRAGLKIGQNYSSDWGLWATALGFEMNLESGARSGFCVFSVDIKFFRISKFIEVEEPKNPMVLVVDAFSVGPYIEVAGKPDTQDAIRTGVIEYIDILTNEILKATDQ